MSNRRRANKDKKRVLRCKGCRGTAFRQKAGALICARCMREVA